MSWGYDEREPVILLWEENRVEILKRLVNNPKVRRFQALNGLSFRLKIPQPGEIDEKMQVF
jgi:hypothetical protein